MANTYDNVSRMYERACERISAEPEFWQSFLKTAGRNFNLRFDEQLLIFLQKPDATAVMQISQWNETFGRRVKPGTSGIAVFETAERNTKHLKYYYDISDTSFSDESKKVPLWEMSPEYESTAIQLLEKDYGTLKDKSTLAAAVLSAADNAVNNQNSYELNDLLRNSIAYLMMSRLGIDTSEYFSTKDFAAVARIKELSDVVTFGLNVSSISKTGLRDIRNYILSNKSQERSNNDERNRTQGNLEHDARRSHKEGYSLRRYDSVGRPDTGTDFAGGVEEGSERILGGREGTSEYVRSGSSELHYGEQTGAVRRIDERRGDTASYVYGGRGEKSLGNGGTTHQSDERANGTDRAYEDNRPNEVGSGYELHRSHGSGNSIHSGNIRISDNTEKYTQISFSDIINKAEEEEASAFSISQELVDAVLTNGSGVENGKMRIYEQFQKNLSHNENAKFLQNEYGIGGRSPAVAETNISEQHDSKGIRISEGFGNDTSYVLLSWKQVETRIAELIAADKYLNQAEKEHYSKWIEKQQVKASVSDYKPPTITCEWSESEAFEDGKTYSVSDFDRIMKNADAEMIEGRQKAIEHYGSEQAWLEADYETDEYRKFMGYYKTKFTVNMPDGTTYSERQDIGDGDGGVIDFLKQYPSYNSVVEQLEKAISTENEAQNDTTGKTPGTEHSDVFFVNKENASVTWMYYNPDSTAGGQYVTNKLNFSEIAEITEDSQNADEFFDRLGSIANQTLADMGTEWFAEAENQFLKQPDFADCTSETMLSLIQTANAEYEVQQPFDEKEQTAEQSSELLEKLNFDLKSNEVETVGKKERYRRNIQAIKTLQTCKSENRLATPTEQALLSKYVGWGGISEAFDENNSSWATEYAELKGLLTDDEYAAARASTRTAFFTPPEVISAIYKALDNMGFNGGNLLEPSCGIGHFIGMLPENMQNSKVFGVELDNISASIAKQLYQKASIENNGFEKTKLPDNFFDCVVGNVPFDDIKVLDKRYDKYNFFIHDYFMAKSLDKLRPGGIMAVVTSRGTMDKKNSKARRYIAQRAELLGAIRLPNNTFKGNAGTEVVSDILFFQKRDRITDIDAEWTHVSTDENGIAMNSYFVQHPEMILGEMKTVSGRFGETVTCVPFDNVSLSELLDKAVSNIRGKITEYKTIAEDETNENVVQTIPADPTVRNYSFTVVDDKVCFRENSVMTFVNISPTVEKRIKGMIEIRDTLRQLIEMQTEDYEESEMIPVRRRLNQIYDNYTKKYGLISSKANVSAFSSDSSFPLLNSLEEVDDNGKLKKKADIFFKRTIKPHRVITSVDTASEALAVSLAEKAGIDIEYMCKLTDKTEEQIFNELQGVIFLNPLYNSNSTAEKKYLPADEYLSGNVREKLEYAQTKAAIDDRFSVNVEALKKVIPKDLSASEISVRLGATWLPVEIVEQFMFEFLDTPNYAQWNIKVHYSQYTGEWSIEGKNYDRTNIKAYNTYGTSRINAYKIIEETLNLKDVRIFDYYEDDDGKKKAELNKKETAIAQSKQERIKQGFQDWIWADPERRDKLTTLYNQKFNSIRPREYDGSHIAFSGINPEIELRTHQQNAVAHILYGGNTLLAHAVGAGKTFEMVAAAQESKQLGLCNKSLFVVPNHLTEQWAAEYLTLYPAANILVATKKDFETANRKKFCGRIATGDYDAVIIGHSQFEKIPMSVTRQRAILEQQLEEITQGISELKHRQGERFTVKQLEKSRKSVQLKLEKLNNQSRKDDVVTFEELGVDRLFIDESHYYKNLFLYTKMRNVGGIAQTEAQKSSDLFMKCRYLDELTGGRGIVFATGTPISNSMVELYTIQRYLQYNALKQSNLQNFDAWASTFGETVTAVELTPEGTGYRAKTRFSRFYNLPELMNMFKQVADIKTADMLNLPVPQAEYHNVAVRLSDIQKQMVAELADRAEAVRSGNVDPTVDNMLRITNDGRKLALDQRLINPMLPDFENSKVNACVNNVFRIWNDTAENRSTQLIFCDLSTPKNKDEFSVYNDIRDKLIAKGIPENEIAFIHDAKTETKKNELFKKTCKGEVRVLLGSTQKMGAGTNVQDRLIALHDLDCPWRPSDLEQRSGRIIRQGNKNAKVGIYRYVTEETFDAYLYQLVEGKQKFASQIMTSKSPVRSAEDIDETALSYAEIKMLAAGNPYIKEKMDLDIQVQKLSLLKSNFMTEKYALEDKIIKAFPERIAYLESYVAGLKEDVALYNRQPKPQGDEKFAGMMIANEQYNNRTEAGQAIIDFCKTVTDNGFKPLGEYRGFKTQIYFSILENKYMLQLKGKTSIGVALGSDASGNITRIDNGLDKFPELLKTSEAELENIKLQLANAKIEVQKPFPSEQELKEKLARLNELNILLNIDGKSSRKDSQADNHSANDGVYSDDSDCRYISVDEIQAKAIVAAVSQAKAVKSDDGRMIIKYPASEQEKVSKIVDTPKEVKKL